MASRTAELQDILEGFRVFKRAIEEAVRCQDSGFHVTSSQWQVLDYVRREGGSSIKKLSTELGVSSSATTQMVNELVKSGYAEKDSLKEDGRVAVVVLSPKTEQALKSLHAHVLRNMNSIFSVLSDKELETFCVLQTKVVRSVNLKTK